MADAPYLVALALVEIAGQRALPLTGQSQASGAEDGEDPGERGQKLALELLVRLFQRSDEGPLQRAAAESSLLVLELPLEAMSQQLPVLKANWLASGDTEALFTGLQSLAIRGWRLSIAKYEPVRFISWP